MNSHKEKSQIKQEIKELASQEVRNHPSKEKDDLKNNEKKQESSKNSEQWQKLESAFSPIIESFKLLAKQQLNDTSIKEGESTLRLKCYELIVSGIQYALNSSPQSTQLQINIENTDKSNTFESKIIQAKNYISKFKKYLSSESQKSSYTQFTQSTKNKDQNDSDEEGFFDEENIGESQNKGKSRNKQKKESIISYDIRYKNDEKSSILLAQNEEKIRQLEESVKSRDNYLNSLTKGYMKDIVHMKEMAFKKDIEDTSTDFYEVSYFDTLQGLDESTLKAVKEKLLSIKQEFSEKQQAYLKKIAYLQNECEKSKKLYNTLLNTQGDTYEMLKRIFHIQDNPYTLWKQIQEIIGNKFFFDVFEKQRPEYGINYKEVNQMLLSKRAYEREYSAYKQQVDDQLISLIGRCRVEIEEIRKEISLNEEEILKLTSEREKYSQNKTNEMLDQMKDFLEERVDEERQLYERERQMILIDCVDRDRLQMRSVFQRWILVKDILKIKQSHFEGESLISLLKRVIFGKNPVVADRIRQNEFKLEQAEEQYKQTLGKLEESEMRSIIHLNQISDYELKQKQLEFEVSTHKSQITYLKQQVKQLESKSIMQKGVILNIHKILQNKIEDTNFESLDAEEERLLSAKNLMKKIESKQQQRSAREELLMLEKIQLIHGEIVNLESNKDQCTLTELFDVNQNINFQTAFEKQFKQYKIEIATQFEKETQNLRDQLEEYEQMEENGEIFDNSDKKSELLQKRLSSKRQTLLFKTILDDCREDKEVQTDGQEIEDQSTKIKEMQEEMLLLRKKLKHKEQDLNNFKDGKNIEKKGGRNENWSVLKNGYISNSNSNNKQIIKRSSLQLISNEDDQNKNNNNNNIKKQKRRKVFQRLFDDSKNKVARMNQLRQHVDSLEQFQWEEVLAILNLFSKQQSALNDIDYDKEVIQSYSSPNKTIEQQEQKQQEQPAQLQQKQNEKGRLSPIDKTKKTKGDQDNLVRPMSRAEFYYKKNNSRYELWQQNQQQQQLAYLKNEKGAKRRGESSFESFEMLSNESFEINRKSYVDSFQSGFRKRSIKLKNQLGNKNNPELPAKMMISQYPKFEQDQGVQTKSQKRQTSFNFYSTFKILNTKEVGDPNTLENNLYQSKTLGRTLSSENRDYSPHSNTLLKQHLRNESQGRCFTAGNKRTRLKQSAIQPDKPSNIFIDSTIYSFLKQSDNSLLNSQND